MTQSHAVCPRAAHAFSVVLDDVLGNTRTRLLKEHVQALAACARAEAPAKNGVQELAVSKFMQDEVEHSSAPPCGKREVTVSTVADDDINTSTEIAPKLIGSEWSEIVSSASSNSVEATAFGRRSSITPLRNAAAAAEEYGHDYDVHTRARLHLLTSMRTRTKGKGSRIVSSIIAYLQLAYRHPMLALDSLMALVIILNAVAIGASSDTSDWHGWIVVDLIFCIFFLFECIAKCCLLGVRNYLCGPDMSWQVFELVLLVASMLEVFLAILASEDDTFRGSSLFRIFRLARLLKILRICRLQFISDLILMINGVIGGLRTLFWSIVSISLPLYMVALVLRETLGQETSQSGLDLGADSFSTLTKSFFNVFRCVVAMDCADERGRPIFVLVSAQHGWAYGVIYGLTVVVMTFGLFNVIIAIYVENTVAAAKYNEMKLKEDRLRNQKMFKEKTVQLAILAYSLKNRLDMNDILHGDIDMEAIYRMEIMQEEWHDRICDNLEFSDLLGELDIAPADQKGLFDALDVDNSGSLDIDELIHGIKKLRGDARKSDVVTVILRVRRVTQMLEAMGQILDGHTGILQQLTQKARACENDSPVVLLQRRKSSLSGKISPIMEM